jgi:hypothetical protein
VGQTDFKDNFSDHSLNELENGLKFLIKLFRRESILKITVDSLPSKDDILYHPFFRTRHSRGISLDANLKSFQIYLNINFNL